MFKWIKKKIKEKPAHEVAQKTKQAIDITNAVSQKIFETFDRREGERRDGDRRGGPHHVGPLANPETV